MTRSRFRRLRPGDRLLLMQWFGFGGSSRLHDGAPAIHPGALNIDPDGSKASALVADASPRADDPARRGHGETPNPAIHSLACRDIKDEIWRRLGW
jgi:hypothetical protein